MVDNRFSEKDVHIASSATYIELKAYANLPNLQYHQMAMILNKRYGMQYDYPVIISNGSEYAEFLNQTGRNSVWLKPNLIYDTLVSRPDCEWIAFLDSDAIFYIDKHRLSLSEWFSVISEHKVSPHYIKGLDDKMARKSSTWTDDGTYFYIGLNGAVAHPNNYGNPHTVMETTHDFACAGSFFVKNIPEGRTMIHEWIYGPDRSENTNKTMQYYATNWGFEQRILNLYAIPGNIEGVRLYSFMDFGFQQNNGIRHIWRDWSANDMGKAKREKNMRKVMRELGLLPPELARKELCKSKGSVLFIDGWECQTEEGCHYQMENFLKMKANCWGCVNGSSEFYCQK